jgi:hypothetical protein
MNESINQSIEDILFEGICFCFGFKIAVKVSKKNVSSRSRSRSIVIYSNIWTVSNRIHGFLRCNVIIYSNTSRRVQKRALYPKRIHYYLFYLFFKSFINNVTMCLPRTTSAITLLERSFNIILFCCFFQKRGIFDIIVVSREL